MSPELSQPSQQENELALLRDAQLQVKADQWMKDFDEKHMDTTVALSDDNGEPINWQLHDAVNVKPDEANGLTEKTPMVELINEAGDKQWVKVVDFLQTQSDVAGEVGDTQAADATSEQWWTEAPGKTLSDQEPWWKDAAESRVEQVGSIAEDIGEVAIGDIGSTEKAERFIEDFNNGIETMVASVAASNDVKAEEVNTTEEALPVEAPNVAEKITPESKNGKEITEEDLGLSFDNLVTDTEKLAQLISDPESMVEQFKEQFPDHAEQVEGLIYQIRAIAAKEIVGTVMYDKQVGELSNTVQSEITEMVNSISGRVNLIDDSLDSIPQALSSFNNQSIYDAKRAMAIVQDFTNSGGRGGDVDSLHSAARTLQQFHDDYSRLQPKIKHGLEDAESASRQGNMQSVEASENVRRQVGQVNTLYNEAMNFPPESAEPGFELDVKEVGATTLKEFKQRILDDSVDPKDKAMQQTLLATGSVEEQFDILRRGLWQDINIAETDLLPPNRLGDNIDWLNRVAYQMAEYGDTYMGQLREVEYELQRTITTIENGASEIGSRVTRRKDELQQLRGTITQLRQVAER